MHDLATIIFRNSPEELAKRGLSPEDKTELFRLIAVNDRRATRVAEHYRALEELVLNPRLEARKLANTPW